MSGAPPRIRDAALALIAESDRQVAAGLRIKPINTFELSVALGHNIKHLYCHLIAYSRKGYVVRGRKVNVRPAPGGVVVTWTLGPTTPAQVAADRAEAQRARLAKLRAEADARRGGPPDGWARRVRILECPVDDPQVREMLAARPALEAAWGRAA